MFVQHSFSKVGFKFKQRGEKKEKEGRCFYTRLCNLCYKSMFSRNLRFRPTSKCFCFTNTLSAPAFVSYSEVDHERDETFKIIKTNLGAKST